MKRKFFAFIFLLTAGLSLSSCLNTDDNDNVEYTHDTAITAFSLGKLDKYAKTSVGNDTILQAKIDGSSYKFYIDQTTHQIYNPDSLPKGAKTSAVLATISSKSSSPIVLMNEAGDSIKSYYSSSDSIDFSKPRYIRVYSNEGTAYVTYTVTVNVHQEDPDSFVWHSLASQNAALASLQDMKAVAVNSSIYVFGINGTNLKVYKTDNGASWDEIVPLQALESGAYQNVVALDGAMYVLSNGQVLKSEDASSWEVVSADGSLKMLIGSSSKYLYALTVSGISVSKDHGATWIPESLDANAENLPTQGLNMVYSSIRSTKNAENLLLIGNRGAEYGDSIATIWTHTVDYSANADAGLWNYLELDKNQPYKMPMMDELQVAVGDSGYVALGSNHNWYKSKDGGLTWRVDSLVSMPEAFNGKIKFAFVKDSSNYYWVINGGNVWKGRFNREGWRKEQTIFD